MCSLSPTDSAFIEATVEEKTLVLNGLMEKYQPEGQYDPIQSDMRVLDAVSIIKVTPQTLHGKYKKT